MTKQRKPLTCSVAEARKISLTAQGLSQKGVFGTGPDGDLAALRHLGYVQIDTISVVARAHEHVLWTRTGDGTSLGRLLENKSAFEYWSHAASYLPMEDYRFSLPRKRRFSSGEHHWFTPTTEHKSWRRRILSRIRSEGPLAARDFAAPDDRGKSGNWFQWKPAKQALEQLFMEGKLMVASRQGFQKRYDLTERVLPSTVDTHFPSPGEHARHLIRSTLRSHGLARAAEISYVRRTQTKIVAEECRRMLREGELSLLQVGSAGQPHLVLTESWGRLQASATSGCDTNRILNPFDGQVLRRKRLRELFDFDFLIECYVPEAKRVYGYFCLPILAGTEFVGRMDAKAVREEGVLEIRALHAQSGFKPRDIAERIWPEIEDYARFNGCHSVRLPWAKSARLVRRTGV